MSGLIICAPWVIARTQVFGIFAMENVLGVNGKAGITSRYDFATMVSTIGGTLTVSNRLYACGSCGNGEYGIVAGGTNGTATYMTIAYTYTYANDVTATGALLSVARQYPASASNGDFGIFAGGFLGAPPYYSNVVDRYVLANKTVGTTTSLPLGRTQARAVGNGAFALFNGGQGGNSTNKVDQYNYSSQTFTPSVLTLVASGMIDGVGYGITTEGFLAGGNNGGTTVGTDRIVYSTMSRTNGTSLLISAYKCGSAADASIAYIGGGNSSAAMSGYVFATAIITTATSLDVARTVCTALCSAPGHF